MTDKIIPVGVGKRSFYEGTSRHKMVFDLKGKGWSIEDVTKPFALTRYAGRLNVGDFVEILAEDGEAFLVVTANGPETGMFYRPYGHVSGASQVSEAQPVRRGRPPKEKE